MDVVHTGQPPSTEQYREGYRWDRRETGDIQYTLHTLFSFKLLLPFSLSVHVPFFPTVTQPSLVNPSLSFPARMSLTPESACSSIGVITHRNDFSVSLLCLPSSRDSSSHISKALLLKSVLRSVFCAGQLCTCNQ